MNRHTLQATLLLLTAVGLLAVGYVYRDRLSPSADSIVPQRSADAMLMATQTGLLPSPKTATTETAKPTTSISTPTPLATTTSASNPIITPSSTPTTTNTLNNASVSTLTPKPTESATSSTTSTSAPDAGVTSPTTETTTDPGTANDPVFTTQSTDTQLKPDCPIGQRLIIRNGRRTCVATEVINDTPNPDPICQTGWWGRNWRAWSQQCYCQEVDHRLPTRHWSIGWWYSLWDNIYRFFFRCNPDVLVNTASPSPNPSSATSPSPNVSAQPSAKPSSANSPDAPVSGDIIRFIVDLSTRNNDIEVPSPAVHTAQLYQYNDRGRKIYKKVAKSHAKRDASGRWYVDFTGADLSKSNQIPSGIYCVDLVYKFSLNSRSNQQFPQFEILTHSDRERSQGQLGLFAYSAGQGLKEVVGMDFAVPSAQRNVFCPTTNDN